jgi:hypothetical protein
MYRVGKRKGITTEVRATERGAGKVERIISDGELPLLLEIKSICFSRDPNPSMVRLKY